MNLLYDAFRSSMKGSSWKTEPQKFEANFLYELVKLKKELDSREYVTAPETEFTINERGKLRHIHGARMRDRVVRHTLCDNELTPKLNPYLIYAITISSSVGITNNLTFESLALISTSSPLGAL